MIRRAVVLAIYILSASCIASTNDWNTYITLVREADHSTIEALPVKVSSFGDTLDDQRAQTLATAISIALIKNPILVLASTNVIEESTEELQTRFGTSLICSIPVINQSTQVQIEAYFAKAEPALIMAGPTAAKCLEIMRDTIGEIRQEIARSSQRAADVL